MKFGFRSKVFVMAGWVYDYLVHGREARLITGPVKVRIRDPRGIDREHVHLERSATLDQVAP